MGLISKKVHAVLDYASVVLLVAAPWLFGFADVKAAMLVSVIAGIIVLMTSLITAYPGGVFPRISMKAHLTLDVLLGIVLAVSPWIFDFKDQVYLPHLIIGLFSVFAGSVTTRSGKTR